MVEDLYDPGEYTVGEVLEYTDGADLDEVQRVQEAEEAGKARSTLLDALSKQLAVKGWSTSEEDEDEEAEPAVEEAAGPEGEAAADEVYAAGYKLIDGEGWVLEKEE